MSQVGDIRFGTQNPLTVTYLTHLNPCGSEFIREDVSTINISGA
jgi:hypothetical protein